LNGREGKAKEYGGEKEGKPETFAFNHLNCCKSNI
jgi:hypothetical protein